MLLNCHQLPAACDQVVGVQLYAVDLVYPANIVVNHNKVIFFLKGNVRLQNTSIDFISNVEVLIFLPYLKVN